jgi:hypothetical protein
VRAIRLAAPFTASDATVPIRCPYTSAVIEIAAWPSSLDTTAMSAPGGEHERGGTVPQPVETHRGQLLTGAFAEALYAGRPFRAILRDLGLTSNQVWAHPNRRLMAHRVRDRVTATRRDHLKHVTTRAYVRGYVCRECREHQRIRMARNRG